MSPELPQRKVWSVEHAARHDGQSEDSLVWLVRLFLPATFGDFWNWAPRALSVHGLLERRCVALRGLLQGIVGEMGVARGGLGVVRRGILTPYWGNRRPKLTPLVL